MVAKSEASSTGVPALNGRMRSIVILAGIVFGVLAIALAVVLVQKKSHALEQVRSRNPDGTTQITLKAGGDLQAALDSANFGDTIVLEAGAVSIRAIDDGTAGDEKRHAVAPAAHRQRRGDGRLAHARQRVHAVDDLT